MTRLSKQRMHQQEFRQRVLRAYREQCATCRLRHQELLDAAHIVPDGHPRGEPVVPNGLARQILKYGLPHSFPALPIPAINNDMRCMNSRFSTESLTLIMALFKLMA